MKCSWILVLLLLSVAPARAADISSAPNGIWGHPGYAEVMVLSSDEVVVYDVTPMSCLESERLPRSDLFVLFREVSDASSPDRLVLHDEGVDYFFEQLSTLPRRCEEPPQKADARLRLDVVASYLDAMYPSFAARDVDWALVLDQARIQVRPESSERELWDALEVMLESLDDPHVFANNDVEGPSRRVIRSGSSSGLRKLVDSRHPGISGQENRTIRGQIEGALDVLVAQELLRGSGTFALRDNVAWGRVSEEVGYLRIKKLTGFLERSVKVIDPVLDAVDEVMEQALLELEGIEALILDLRLNPGGNDVIATKFVERLIDRPTALRIEVPGAAGFAPAQVVTVAPNPGRRFTGPVYVLISGSTVSAAESIVLLLKDFDHVTLVGEPTRGAFSDINFKLLPGGGYVGIPNMLVSDASGETFEGRGIPPDIEAPIFSDEAVVSSFRDVIDAVLEMVRQRSQ